MLIRRLGNKQLTFMKKIYPHQGGAQDHRCSTILRRSINGFVGSVELEDSHPCGVRVVFRDGESLRIDIFSCADSWKRHTILRRNPKLHSWEDSDFVGILALENECRYFVGVVVLSGQDLKLKVYFRPLHLQKASRTLRVVK
jgi:hypothetical protein